MNYRLIALDLDGTLLNDDKQIAPETEKVLNELRNKGIYIAICTGRSVHSTRPLLSGSSFSTHVITDNGGMILDGSADETIYADTIPRHFLETMKEIMETYGVFCDVTTAENMYVEHLTEEGRKLYQQYLMEPVVIHDLRNTPHDPIKFTIFGEPNVLDVLIKDLETEFGQQLKPVRSGEYFIDIMKHGTSKKAGLQKLGERLNVKPEQTLAIGNYYNDLEMLQYAGMGIVVDNAPDDLKQIADDVTLSNNDEGVRHALEKWVFQRS